MITGPSTPPPTHRNLIPDSAEPPTDASSISHPYAPPTPDSNTSSPRNAVAKRLSDLNLRSLDVESVLGRPSPKRKRVRTAESNLDAGVEEWAAIGRADVVQADQSAPDLLDHPPIGNANSPYDQDSKASEGRGNTAVTLEPISKLHLLADTVRSEPETAITAPSRRRVIAKPKSKRKQSPLSQATQSITKPDPDTWQEHEITGHLMQDADDDGYGINGIGFRPTPAIAYERSQKRKMQLNAWRVREGNEAREKRGERRRKVDGETSKPSSFVGSPVNVGHVDAGSNQDGESGGRHDARIVRFA